MKNLKISSCLLALLLIYTSLNALTFQSAKGVEKRKLGIAIAPLLAQGVACNVPTNVKEKPVYFGGFFIGEYGASDSINLILRTGYAMEEAGLPYAGLETKFILSERFGGTDVFALNIGGHWSGGPNGRFEKSFGVDVALVAGNFFFKFDNYLGFDFDFDFVKDTFKPEDNEKFTPTKICYPGEFIFGAKLTPFANKNNGIIIEGGIPVTSYSSYRMGFAYSMII